MTDPVLSVEHDQDLLNVHYEQSNPETGLDCNACVHEDAIELKAKIIRSLEQQGFQVDGGAILIPGELSKDKLRELHTTAVEHKLERSRDGLIRQQERLLEYVASGRDIDPLRISPRLVEVLPDSTEELLFRYASLHWSIPVSSGYGKRLRFVVIDDSNQKLIGLIGLGDPVYGLGPRDDWIGWTQTDRRERLRNVMDAFVLGAVPPYSFLLCGKLVAMLAATNTVREAFMRKYQGTRSIIRDKEHDGNLALVTTTSALGRSSVYTRLRVNGERLYTSVGYTKGSGEFHFSNGLYGAIAEFVQVHCTPTEKQQRWGTGFRNRREVIKKCLTAIGLSQNWLYHGVEREVFVVPLAHNSREFLCGAAPALDWRFHPEQKIFDYFKDRWLLPRASWDDRFRSWSKEEWRLWPDGARSYG